jgi:hypothetical protein
VLLQVKKSGALVPRSGVKRFRVVIGLLLLQIPHNAKSAVLRTVPIVLALYSQDTKPKADTLRKNDNDESKKRLGGVVVVG